MPLIPPDDCAIVLVGGMEVVVELYATVVGGSDVVGIVVVLGTEVVVVVGG